MGWLDDLENDIEGALDTLADVVNAIKDAIQTGAQIAGDVVNPGGAALMYIVNGVTYKLADLIGISIRGLTGPERNILRGVFLDSVPLDRIMLTSVPGKDGRAFTIPGTMIAPLSAFIPDFGLTMVLSGLVLHLHDKFLINVGDMYKDDSLIPSTYDINQRERAGSLLVHESTHVWQGVNGAFSWWYVFNSLYNQIKSGQNAYAVDETHLQTWDSYGVEQQAVLVEHWYARGSQVTDGNYPFIRDNIRPARPWAQTLFSISGTPLLARNAGSMAGSVVGRQMTTGKPPGARGPANAATRPGSGGVQ